MGILFLGYGRGGKNTGESPKLDVIRQLVRHPPFWILGAVFSAFLGSRIGVYTLLPLFLTKDIGMEREWQT